MKYSKKYKVYTWKDWIFLHYIINPGLAFNELIFGIRIPKIILEDQTLGKPKINGSYIPCPHCQTLHNSKTWSKKNKTALKNWFGYYCPECGEIIPCMTNLTTYLILGITYPLWIGFKKKLKQKWLKKQPKRFEHLDLSEDPAKLERFNKKNWIITGLISGGTMFVLISLILPFIGLGDSPITWHKILISIPICLVAGLGFGFFMKIFLNKKGKQYQSKT